MHQPVECVFCGAEISRPVGKEEDHIWARIELDTGVWCSQCRGNSQLKEGWTFCSPECLEKYMKSGTFTRWKDRFRKEAASAAQRIRKEKH